MTEFRKKAEELLEIASNQFYKNQNMQWIDFLPLIEATLREVANSTYEKAAKIAEKEEEPGLFPTESFAQCTKEEIGLGAVRATKRKIATKLREEIKKSGMEKLGDVLEGIREDLKALK